MDIKEIRRSLTSLGYHVIDGDYYSEKGPVFLGLILKKGDNETVLADIRRSEGEKIVIPYWNEKENPETSKLRKILFKEKLDYRDTKNSK